MRGGQTEADRRLARLDIRGYAERRSEVLPVSGRGASQLSPWIRHGLLGLRTVWDAVAEAPTRDRAKYRDELLWQEYARHWYARLGPATRRGVRHESAHVTAGVEGDPADDSWPRGLACIDAMVAELDNDGWLVNQARMWLASHWTVRLGRPWRVGEDAFFRHLLDGSRAANRLGWQWTSGIGSSKAYGFSRRQVEKRAPDLCRGCAHRTACPIDDWPREPALTPVGAPPGLRRSQDPIVDSGPTAVLRHGRPDTVWITAESLGDGDAALVARPDLPVVFVFDVPLLQRLRLDAKRLVFLTECLSDLATRRDVEVYRGVPQRVLADRAVAVTFAPVPGFRRRADLLGPVELHPWPWLTVPVGGPVQSFSAWRKGQRV